MAEDNKITEEAALVEWLRLVDRPVGTKDKKDRRVNNVSDQQSSGDR